MPSPDIVAALEWIPTDELIAEAARRCPAIVISYVPPGDDGGVHAMRGDVLSIHRLLFHAVEVLNQGIREHAGTDAPAKGPIYITRPPVLEGRLSRRPPAPPPAEIEPRQDRPATDEPPPVDLSEGGGA